MSEDAWNDKITELTNANWEVLEKRGVRRVSILICQRATYPNPREFSGRIFHTCCMGTENSSVETRQPEELAGAIGR